MEILLEYSGILVSIAVLIGFLMAWGIGANDVANAMATSIGTKSLTIKQAIIIAAIFEFLGAYLAGGEVVNTIKDGIVDNSAFADQPISLTLGMISALFAAGTWLIVASILGWPVSTTHSIIGAVIGFSVITVGSNAIQWNMLWGILGSWFVTPILSGIFAYLLFMSVQYAIFRHYHPLEHAKRIAPVYIAITFFTLSIITIKSGLKHIGLEISNQNSFLIAVGIAVLTAVAGKIFINKIQFEKNIKRKHYVNVEKVFSVLMIVTACAMAFAHGSNDVANAIGPLSAVVSSISSGSSIADGGNTPLEGWILPLGAFGIVFGLATLGYKVMKTVGVKITQLTPSRGFAAQLATAITVVLASATGLPISTTQTLVGAIIGVGLARGIAAINLAVIRNIFSSWVITLPSGAILAIVFFKILSLIFC